MLAFYFRTTGHADVTAISAVLFPSVSGDAGNGRRQVVLVGGWMLPQQPAPRRLARLYAPVAGSTVIGALTLGVIFALWPPNRRSRVLSG